MESASIGYPLNFFIHFTVMRAKMDRENGYKEDFYKQVVDLIKVVKYCILVTKLDVEQ